MTCCSIKTIKEKIAKAYKGNYAAGIVQHHINDTQILMKSQGKYILRTLCV